MKKHILLLLYFVISVLSSLSIYAQIIPTDSLFLGQTPPGNMPKVFNLPVTAGLHAVERLAITSDGKEIYYSELNTYEPTIERTKYFKYAENKWQGPFIVFEGYMAPRLSANDSIIYMQKNVNNIATAFFSKRIDSGWSMPARLLSLNKQTHYFQTTNLNNAYLSSNLSGSTTNRDICRLITSNSDTVIQSLGLPINTPIDENDFFFPGDESYMLVSRSSATTAGDIYISYKKNNGGWTNPKALGSPINTPNPNWEYGHFVTKDNKYLFFTRGGNSMSSYYIYWVKVDNIIDSLKHTNFIPYLKNQISTQSIQVGQVYNFTVPDTTFIDDDGNNTLTYSAVLSNDSPLPAWLSFNPATRTFVGTPTETSNLDIKVIATDSANKSTSCIFSISTISGVNDNEKVIPERTELCQNYPNPFNPATKIKFAVSKAGKYSLSVYDILGRLVEVISDKVYAAGYHEETFNANGIASGMYIYRLKGENVNIMGKMMLLR